METVRPADRVGAWITEALGVIDDGVVVVDPTGTVVWVNPAMEAMAGLPSGRATGRPFTVVVHLVDDADGERIGDLRGRYAEMGVAQLGRSTIVRGDGTRIPVADRGVIVKDDPEHAGSVVASFHDLSAEIAAQAELEARSTELQLMLDNMINAFIVWEPIYDADGGIVSMRFGYFNDEYAKVAKVGPEVRGKDVFDVWPTTEQSWVDVYAEIAVTGKPQTFEMYHNSTNGWYHCNAYRSAGPSSGVCVIFEDITERKTAEAEERQEKASLEQRVLERTAELETAVKELEAFSYSVSHDLRGPLRAIDGFVHILEDDYGCRLDEEGLQLCAGVSRNARRMGRLIDDLLSFSRLGRAEIDKRLFDMAAVVQSAFDALIQQFGNDRVTFRLGDLGEVVGDPILLRQVWDNLLSNALKYSSKSQAATIEIGVERLEGETVFSVRDNGVGFDMEYDDKLFRPFQRLHGATEYEGSGVGLAIVQRLVARHGGRVWATGEVGKGATFSFSLPS
jgi:PAS domain S-box-containing protein